MKIILLLLVALYLTMKLCKFNLFTRLLMNTLWLFDAFWCLFSSFICLNIKFSLNFILLLIFDNSLFLFVLVVIICFQFILGNYGFITLFCLVLKFNLTNNFLLFSFFTIFFKQSNRIDFLKWCCNILATDNSLVILFLIMKFDNLFGGLLFFE